MLKNATIIYYYRKPKSLTCLAFFSCQNETKHINVTIATRIPAQYKFNGSKFP